MLFVPSQQEMPRRSDPSPSSPLLPSFDVRDFFYSFLKGDDYTFPGKHASAASIVAWQDGGSGSWQSQRDKTIETRLLLFIPLLHLEVNTGKLDTLSPQQLLSLLVQCNWVGHARDLIEKVLARHVFQAGGQGQVNRAHGAYQGRAAEKLAGDHHQVHDGVVTEQLCAACTGVASVDGHLGSLLLNTTVQGLDKKQVGEFRVRVMAQTRVSSG